MTASCRYILWYNIMDSFYSISLSDDDRYYRYCTENDWMRIITPEWNLVQQLRWMIGIVILWLTSTRWWFNIYDISRFISLGDNDDNIIINTSADWCDLSLGVMGWALRVTPNPYFRAVYYWVRAVRFLACCISLLILKRGRIPLPLWVTVCSCVKKVF